MGLDLAIPVSPGENDAVKEVVRILGGGNVWIGFSDRGDEAFDQGGQFRRVDTGAIIGANFSAFAPGEPNNTFDEDCVEMRADGNWNDESCFDANGWVCELR
jgi:hypothetical protein